MQQKQKSRRAITAPFQLVIQSNDYLFISCDLIKKDSFGLLFKKLYAGPVKVQQIDKTGSPIIRIPKYQIDDKKKVAQEILVYNINNQGLYLNTKDLQRWPARLYTQIPNLKTDQEITDFIQKTGFCDFPIKEEAVRDNKYYLSKFVPTETGIRAKNWLQMYRKISILSRIIEGVSKNKITKQDINYLLEQKKQNILEMTFDKNSFPNKELADPDIKFKKSDFLTEFKDQKIQITNTISGYRIFGYFALCCLELLLDIQKGDLARFCQNKFCKKPLPLDVNGNRKYCDLKTNPECYRQWRASEKRKERTGIKLQRINKRVKRLKRRFL